MAPSLLPLFEPQGVAIVGASSDPTKFGGRPLRSMIRHGFRGDLHVVNPTFTAFDGVTAHPQIEDLPFGLDLAVVLLPAAAAVEAVRRCLDAGARSIMVCSGGFGEAGSAGIDAQFELSELVQHAGVALLGPNTPGFLSTGASVACSASGFLVEGPLPERGNVSLVAQSGAVAGVIASRLIGRRVGLDLVVCTGNEPLVTTADVIRHIVSVGRSRAIGLYLESFQDRDLVDAIAEARAAEIGIVVLQAGRSSAGSDVVASHTGQVVGSQAVADAAIRSLQLVEAFDYDDVVEALTMLRRHRAGRVRDVAVVGASGGMNALLVDHLSACGIGLAVIGDAAAMAIDAITPSFGRSSNPVDVSSDVLSAPERLGSIVSALAQDGAVGDVVVTVSDHPAPLADAIASTLVAVPPDLAPIVQWSSGLQSAEALARCVSHGLAVFTEPSRCARLLSQQAAACSWPPGSSAGPPSSAPLDDIDVVGLGDEPTEHRSKQFLQGVGIAVPRSMLVQDVREVPEAIASLGAVAVVKANGRGEVHKSDIGAVAIGVAPADGESVATRIQHAAEAAWGSARVDGILVEQQVQSVAEFLVAFVRHPGGVCTMTIATGGALVELFDDHVSLLAPASRDDVQRAVDQLGSRRMMDGYRGAPAGDVDALIDLVVRLGRLADLADPPRLVEINPVAVSADGAFALDAVIQVASC